MKIRVHDGDLPEGLTFGPEVAIDTETMGLNPARDRLCLVQLTDGDGVAHLVQMAPGPVDAPNLSRLVADPSILKIIHFARFDVAMLRRHLRVACAPVYCTKIASKLARTYTDRHGLKDLVRELLGIELNKAEQSSDWGARELTDTQKSYAANDVAHLHALKARLDTMLVREKRAEIAAACFAFVGMRAELDLAGWGDQDIFAH